MWGRAFVCVPQTHRWRPEKSVRVPGIGVGYWVIPYGRATSALKSSQVSFANDNVVLQHKKLDVPAPFRHRNLIKESFPSSSLINKTIINAKILWTT